MISLKVKDQGVAGITLQGNKKRTGCVRGGGGGKREVTGRVGKPQGRNGILHVCPKGNAEHPNLAGERANSGDQV